MTQRLEPGRLIAFVAGCRTPFAKAGGFLADETSLDLGRSVLAELLSRAELRADAVDQVVLGTVVPNVQAPNLSREAAFACGLLASTDAFTVSLACASGKAPTSASTRKRFSVRWDKIASLLGLTRRVHCSNRET